MVTVGFLQWQKGLVMTVATPKIHTADNKLIATELPVIENIRRKKHSIAEFYLDENIFWQKKIDGKIF